LIVSIEGEERVKIKLDNQNVRCFLKKL